MIHMSQALTYAKLRRFDDLVRFVGMSPTPFLFHVNTSGKHVYFVQITSFGGGKMVYFADLDSRIEEKYVVFNRYRGEITYSDQFSSDGQSAHIPIFELESTNIFKEYPPV
jgi:hypothetical protein